MAEGDQSQSAPGRSRVSAEDQLNADLERRLRALEEPPHATSECMQRTGLLLMEALAWVTGAVTLWVTAVFWL